MENIATEYATWLQTFHWDYFFTVTFRSPRREPYYAMKGVWTELKKYNVGRAFLGVEPHRTGDLHIHGIMSGMPFPWKPEISLPWDIFDGLFHKFGRSKVEACNSNELVTNYCAKYILKEQSSVSDHYEIFGNTRAWLDKV